jgi:O-antigen ligase
MLLTLSVAVSPRLRVGSIAYDKGIDIRVEDGLIVVAALNLLIHRTKERTQLTTLICIYFIVCAASTFLGVLLGRLDSLRAGLFFAKEIELFAFFPVTLSYIRNSACVKAVLIGLLAGGLANGLFALLQILTGNYLGLEQGYYGVATFGEATAFTVSAYFVIVVLLGLASLDLPSRLIKIAAASCILLGVIGAIAGMSRVSVLGAALVIPVWVIYRLGHSRKFLTKITGLAIVAAVLAVAFWSYGALSGNQWELLAIGRVGGVFQGEAYSEYQRGRVNNIYVDYYEPIVRNPLIGMGKSITGTRLPAEAHNYYLRLMAETGIIGLLLFVSVLVYVFRVALRVHKRSRDRWQRATGDFCILTTVFLMITALAQDTFIVARIAELFWIIAAITIRTDQWLKSQPAHH